MIYWDYNAGAPLLPEVEAALAGSLPSSWGNPSSVHAAGRSSRGRLDDARARVAALLGARSPREVIFTGSGSEAAALAITGAWLARPPGRRATVVSTQVEHPCVLGALAMIERLGAHVVRLAPDASGAVPAAKVVEAIDDEVLLCSMMWANNETGVLQPIAPVAAACRERGVLFHTDAVQAIGRVPVVAEGIDLLSLSAHKLGGPAGVGVLVARREVALAAIVPGHQEDGRRGGTPSVAFAEAAAIALTHAVAQREGYRQTVAPLRARLEAELVSRYRAEIHGAEVERVPNTSSASFPGVDGEALLVALDLDGIAVSAGAACASGSLSPSHVLLAMGRTPAQANASLRFSLGPHATAEELAAVLDALDRHLEACRIKPAR